MQLPVSSSATCDHNNYSNINRLSIIDKRPAMNTFALVENDFNELCHVARFCGWPCSAYGVTRARELLKLSRRRKRRNARLTAPVPNTDANNQEAALSLPIVSHLIVSYWDTKRRTANVRLHRKLTVRLLENRCFEGPLSANSGRTKTPPRGRGFLSR